MQMHCFIMLLQHKLEIKSIKLYFSFHFCSALIFTQMTKRIVLPLQVQLHVLQPPVCQRCHFPQPSTFAHELGDDVDGLLRHDGVELHQLVVPESLHDLSLLQESLGGHGSRLQSLHCYLGGAVPHAWHTEEWMFMRVLLAASEMHRTVTWLKSPSYCVILESMHEVIRRRGSERKRKFMFLMSTSVATQLSQSVCNISCVNTSKRDPASATSPLRLQGVPEVSDGSLTHPHVSEATLSQLPLHAQRFPRNLPGVPRETHGEGDGIGAGLC